MNSKKTRGKKYTPNVEQNSVLIHAWKPCIEKKSNYVSVSCIHGKSNIFSE